MDFYDGKKKIVETFNLTEQSELMRYEAILNDPTCDIYRDNFTYDRAGRPIITIWYVKDE